MLFSAGEHSQSFKFFLSEEPVSTNSSSGFGFLFLDSFSSLRSCISLFTLALLDDDGFVMKKVFFCHTHFLKHLCLNFLSLLDYPISASLFSCDETSPSG